MQNSPKRIQITADNFFNNNKRNKCHLDCCPVVGVKKGEFVFEIEFQTRANSGVQTI